MWKYPIRSAKLTLFACVTCVLANKQVRRVLNNLYLNSSFCQSWFTYQFGLDCPSVESNDRMISLGSTCGLRIEPHPIMAADGVKLTAFRCKTDFCSTPKSFPVLLFHGLMQDGECFLCGGNTHSLAAFLTRAGFDVWICNNRGTNFSQTEEYSTEYWDYCIDDLANLDVPAFVDYISSETKVLTVSCVGFSQGSAQLFAALATNPHLNSQINLFVALAPAVRSLGMTSALAARLQQIPHLLQFVFGNTMMLGFVRQWQRVLSPKKFAAIVKNSMFFLFGWNCRCISEYRRIAIFQHVFSTASVKLVAHWFQIINSGRLCQFREVPRSRSRRKIGWFPLIKYLRGLVRRRSAKQMWPTHANHKSFEGSARHESSLPRQISLQDRDNNYSNNNCNVKTRDHNNTNTSNTTAISEKQEDINSDDNNNTVEYDISRIFCPVALIAGGADMLVDAEFVRTQLAQNCIHYHVEPDFEHLDVIWADRAAEVIYPQISQLLMMQQR